MAVLDKFQVEIIIDGQPAQEYEPDEEEEAERQNQNQNQNQNQSRNQAGGQNQANTVTKYIEAVSGKPFEFRVRIHQGVVWAGADCFVSRPWLDGKNYLGIVLRKPSPDMLLQRPIIIEMTHSGDWFTSSDSTNSYSYNNTPKWFKYRFANLETRDSLSHEGEEQGLEEGYGQLGILKLTLWREKSGGQLPLTYPSQPDSPSLGGSPVAVPEKALKGNALDLVAGLEPETTDLQPYQSVLQTTKVDLLPAATFIFKYRTRKALQSLMIIPRSPSPRPTPTPRPTPRPTPTAIVPDGQPPSKSSKVKKEGSSRQGIKRERQESLGGSLSFRRRRRGSEVRKSRRVKTSQENGKTVYHLDDSSTGTGSGDETGTSSEDEKANLNLNMNRRPAKPVKTKTEVVDLT